MTGRIQKDLERMEGFREAFIQIGWNGSESLILRAIPDKEFQHMKVNNRDVYLDYSSREDIPEDTLRLYWDLTALN